MKFLLRALVLPVVIILMAACSDAGEKSDRITENFNFDWKFANSDIPEAEAEEFDDSGWRLLDLPHDWSIEGPFSSDNASCTGYLPGGIGWYRKSFRAPSTKDGRRVFISFDGVYCNSEVWINGISLGKRPNGYISFQYDLTEWLKPGKTNTIAVRVDHSNHADSRWYTGSGIYRNVKLITIPAVHIKQWGVYATAKALSEEKATVDTEIEVVNNSRMAAEAQVTVQLHLKGRIVASNTIPAALEPTSEKKLSLTMEINGPELWSVDNPTLYDLVTTVTTDEGTDRVTTPVGLRTISFDPQTGFRLNGVSMKLKGICIHHDAGALGSAVPREELARRLDILKELGCNAIRTSHNPFSPDFNDLCDEKGFLVIAEMYDEWELPKKKWLEGWNVGTPGKQGYVENFGDWGAVDLQDFILRDRNHPSIIMWSIGNEVDYPNDPYTHPVLNTEANPQTWARFSESLPHADRLGEVAWELAAIIRELDTTRPVTAGLASALMSNETGYAEALDVVGYNYQEFKYEGDHARYPDRPIYGSENGMSLEMWEVVENNDYVMGQFLWTGMEYLGEAGRFPSRSNTAGLIDLAGNRKPEFYFRQSLWSDKPMIFLGTTGRLTQRAPESLWAHKRVDPLWNYKPGQTISVNAFTNCEEAELFLNSASLGVRKRADFTNRTLSWEIPFEPGTLEVVARNGGTDAATYRLVTAGEPAILKVECSKEAISADRQELVHVFVTITDRDGNLVYGANNEIKCDINGPLRLLGMEDANPVNIEDYKDNVQKAFRGRLLIYLQAMDRKGRATITISSPGLESATFEIGLK
ncbi:MAG: glycoside hydrolase family 2 TIM barrel-domain containing protein [Bacteroidales bacterium]|nr:glycoside hydrolase family 2 TIM barrel-domain containing protein [Bacteroidales bacterium]